MSDPLAMHPQLSRLRGLQFDLFQRYAGLLRVLVAMFPGDVAVRVLDVGSGPHTFARDFLPQRFAIVRADVDDFGDRSIIRLQRGGALPFADRAFDVAIAVDVFEHVPVAERARLAAELGRVAAHAVVATFPDGDDDRVMAAETEYGAVFAAAFGNELDFLSEHREHGLPRAAAIGDALGKGYSWRALPNAPLDEWRLWNGIDALLCARCGDGAEKAAFNAEVNARCDGPVAGMPHYRTIVVAAREASRLDAATAAEVVRPRPAGLGDFAAIALPALVLLERRARASAAAGIAAKDAHIEAMQRMADGLAEGLRLKDAHIEGMLRDASRQHGENA